MGKYILKRLLALIPIIIGVTFIVFFILNLAPGDPARLILGDLATEEEVQALREDMGLNDPIVVQYVRYLGGLLHGDFGTSYRTNESVFAEIMTRLPSSIQMAFASMTIIILLSIPMGVIAALKQNSIFDGFSMIVSLLGLAMPNFWLGLLLIIAFSLHLGWFPSGGAESFRSIILPAFTLGFSSLASITRTTRSSMLEVIRQDYIRTARAKGLSNGKVTIKHALRNALLPTVTVAGLQMGGLLGGSVITETVFAWPGVGRLMITGINTRDIPMVMGCVILYSVIFTLMNFFVDMLYAVIDPRIKSQYKRG